MHLMHDIIPLKRVWEVPRGQRGSTTPPSMLFPNFLLSSPLDKGFTAFPYQCLAVVEYYQIESDLDFPERTLVASRTSTTGWNMDRNSLLTPVIKNRLPTWGTRSESRRGLKSTSKLIQRDAIDAAREAFTVFGQLRWLNRRRRRA